MAARTKKLIAQTLLTLSEQRDPDKITVKDIVDACGISRQTFYYHFGDIMDAVAWAMDQAMQQALEESLQAESVREAMRNFVETAQKNAAFLHRMLHSPHREQVENILLRTFRAFLREVSGPNGLDWDPGCAEREFLLDFYTYGLSGMLLDNCGRPDLDTERFADRLLRLLSEQLPGGPKER